MKCTNPIKCDGEMQPLQGWPQYTECVKCGFRIDTPKAEPKKEVKPVVTSTNEETK